MGNKTWNVKKSSIESCWIETVGKGNSHGKVDKQHLYLSITLTKESIGRKKLELEAKDEAQRQRLFIGFTRLGMEKKQEKVRQKQQMEAIPPSTPAPVPNLAPVSREERRRSIAMAQADRTESVATLSKDHEEDQEDKK